jgi:hypothetical protein
MSEKRRRKEQRRQRRKAKGATRSQARANSIDRVLGQAARLALASVATITDALEAERWASSLVGDWRRRALPGEDPDAVLLPSLAQAFEAIGTAAALASLRALSAIGKQPAVAREAADRLAESGLPEPPWASALGRARPTGAALLEEPIFDDGLGVVIEFDDAYALEVYIDHTLGGLVSSVSLTGPLRDNDAGFREIALDEARARVEAALDALDQAIEPPVDEEVWALRAMVDARLRLLPEGFSLPEHHVTVELAERAALVADFLTAPEGERWRGDEDSEFVIRYAVDFGADENHGGPLRWSPAVVEVFMTDWLPQTLVAEPELFTRVPDVLRDWVGYCGRRRAVPAESVRDAVAAVDAYRDDLLDAVADPDAWSLANALAEAAIEAGVDPADDAALARFMRQREP